MVHITEAKGTRKVVVRTEQGDEKVYTVPYGARLEAKEGDRISAGDQITEGPLNPHDILRVKGVRAAQNYLVRQVQDVYRSEGVEINDKHIEVVIRQMLPKVRVDDPGDTDLLVGGLENAFDLEDENKRVVEAGGRPATARPVILGITKASLATDSFLSAASFDETTRVLTDASIKGRTDPLIGLKENVIIGNLIPAGTGMTQYRSVKLVLPEDAQVLADTKAEEAAESEADTVETRGDVSPETQAPDSGLREMFSGHRDEPGPQLGRIRIQIRKEPIEGVEGTYFLVASAAEEKAESQVGKTAAGGESDEKLVAKSEIQEGSSGGILKAAVMAARFYQRFLKTKSEKR